MNAPTPRELLDAAEAAIDWVGDDLRASALRGPELRAYLSRVWHDDQEGFLVEEASAILRGRIKAVLTDQHVEAICSASRRAVGARQRAAEETGKVPF